MKFLVSLITISIAMFSFSKDIPFIVTGDNVTTNGVIDISGITFDKNITISQAVINNAEKIEATLVECDKNCQHSNDGCFKHLIIKVIAKGYNIDSVIIHMKPESDRVDTSMNHIREFVMNNRFDIMTKVFDNFDNFESIVKK